MASGTSPMTILTASSTWSIRRVRMRTWPHTTPVSTGPRAAVEGRDLDELAPGASRPISLRWVFQHMIEEYARHNGHADLLREAVAHGDRRAWLSWAIAGPTRHETIF